MEGVVGTGASVEWRVDGSIVRVTINRPEKKNALTHAMYASFADAIQHAAGDECITAVLVTAVGDVFTSGNDLFDFAAGVPSPGDRPLVRFLELLATVDVPIVVAVNGMAVGIGVTMLLHSDLVYASSDARFRMPFVNLGLVPEAASSLLLPQLVGHRRAAELLYSGRWFDAAEARSMGLVNDVVAPGDVLAVAEAAARELATKAPRAVRMTKALLRGDAGVIRDRMLAEGAAFDAQLRSAEFAEAFAAFTERRQPDFRSARGA